MRSSSSRYSLMARPEGLEPATPRFVVWYSIQLSYGRTMYWSFRADLNRRSGSCSPLPYHLATEASGRIIALQLSFRLQQTEEILNSFFKGQVE